MKKAFTLLELLVVVGIMGFLGVAASAGYTALVRGMSERGAVATASSALRAAQERARVDRQPTVVYCYNRLVKAPTDNDDSGVAVGEIVAIRRVGRVSRVSGNLLYDEFGDLDGTFERVLNKGDCEKGGGFRLYRFNGGSRAPSKLEYSVVSDRVFSDKEAEQLHMFSCTSEQGYPDGKTNLVAAAFYDMNDSDFRPNWKRGDGYGMEFLQLQLPVGYVFKGDVPTDVSRITSPEIIYFDPNMSEVGDTIEIWSTKPDASGYPKKFKKAGTASSRSEEGV